jgi:hypothetical protein
MSNNIQESKKKLEEALQEFVVAQYGEEHWLGDYVFSAVVLDMNDTGGPQRNHYLHDGRGAFHSMRGLTEEQADWLIDLKEEENADPAQDL